jgi:signal transduction histidine kinase
MRSVYVKILLWCLGTLLLSLVGFVLVSRFVVMDFNGKGSPFERANALQLADAESAYEAGGTDALAERISRVSSFLPGHHYLLGPDGHDLVTGEDRSTLLAVAAERWGEPRRVGPRIVIGATDPVKRYSLIILMDPPGNLWRVVPYYLLIFAAVAMLCWILAARIASPLRQLTRAVERFGSGDLSARTESARQDEIGELARTFDRMAERIGTLLTAERRLMQDISHELRSPLARLRFAVQLSRRADDRDDSAAVMEKEIDRLSELVGALMQVTRAEGDPSSRRSERVDVPALIEEILAGCECETADGRCHLKSSIEPMATVYGDPEMLRRAIENVVENAIRYAPLGSDVEVDLAIKDGNVNIAVRDYGPGVPEDDLTRIFTPFFRVDRSRDEATGGVGLGLAIAKRAIRLHHGEVWAENASPGLQVFLVLPQTTLTE